MFKDTKAIVNKIVDTAAAPIETFDAQLREHPNELIPLAVIHLVPIAMTIAGTVVIIRGAQRVRIEKERTKQAKLNAMRRGCRHGHGHPHGGPVHHDDLPID